MIECGCGWSTDYSFRSPGRRPALFERKAGGSLSCRSYLPRTDQMCTLTRVSDEREVRFLPPTADIRQLWHRWPMLTRYQPSCHATKLERGRATRLLESTLAPVSGMGSSVGHDNDKLAFELEDIFCAAGDMREWGEISDAEVAAVKPLDSLLEKWSGSANADLWRREALWTDERWEVIRAQSRH